MEFTGNWSDLKGRLRQQFAELTGDDLFYAEGEKEKMIGKLQLKLGKTREELQSIIDSLSI